MLPEYYCSPSEYDHARRLFEKTTVKQADGAQLSVWRLCVEVAMLTTEIDRHKQDNADLKVNLAACTTTIANLEAEVFDLAQQLELGQ